MAALERGRSQTVAKSAKSAPVDLADCLKGPYLASGLFFKKSKMGRWQKRLFQLRGPYLIYYDNPKKVQRGIPRAHPDEVVHDSATPDATIDLRRIVKCELVEEDGGIIVMTSQSGKKFELKATTPGDAQHSPRWVESINTQMEGLGATSIDVVNHVSSVEVVVEDDEEDDEDESEVDHFITEADVVAVGEMSFTSQAEIYAHVVKLQSLLRAKQAAKKVEGIKEDKAAEEQGAAATKMQSAFRAKAARGVVATKSAEAKPDHTGDVYKQGHSAFGTSFQKRLFVLNDSDGDGKWTIKYYKGPAEAANLKGTIVLAGASVTKKSTDEFEISTRANGGKVFNCKTDEPAAAEEWFSKITSAIELSA
jgi:hypothetical protein